MIKHWIKPDQLVVVGKTKIRDGLFYLKTEAELGDDIPEAIDRQLDTSDALASFLERPPRYSELSQAQRGAYIRWLSNGRIAVDANVNMVFLFFYGLERRALSLDPKAPESAANFRQLSAENSRLQRIYGHDHDFWNASQHLGTLLSLALDELLPFSFDRVVETEKNDAFTWESLETRIDVAKFARDGKPITAGLAANWFAFVGDSETLGATSDAQESKRGFIRQFGLDHPEGIVLRPRRQAAIQFDYRPANPWLPIIQCEVDIQDMFLAPAALDELTTVAKRSLSSTSAPQSSATPSASSAILDAEPVERSIGSVLKTMVTGKRRALANLSELGKTWARLDKTAPRNLENTAELAAALESHGLGVAPDTRFDSDLEIVGQVLIFELDEALVAPRAEYLASALIVELAAAVAHADDVVANEERELLRRHVADSLELTKDEITRLEFLTEWLMIESNAGAAFDVVGDQVRAQQIDAEAVGAFLVDMAWADGELVESERFILERVCGLLGLDPRIIDRARVEPIESVESVALTQDQVAAGFWVGLKRRDLHERFVH